MGAFCGMMRLPRECIYGSSVLRLSQTQSYKLCDDINHRSVCVRQQHSVREVYIVLDLQPDLVPANAFILYPYMRHYVIQSCG